MPVQAGTYDQRLRREAEILVRYLVAREAPAELVERYVAAQGILLLAPADATDAALVSFVHRHPWSLPFLDAATGLLRPTSVLRSKCLLMGAVLEASPYFVDDFLPRPTATLALVARLGGLAALAVVEVLVGLCIYPVAVTRR